MSIVSTFTSDQLSGLSWASSNKSDSSFAASADGGSITRKLGDPDVLTQSTVVYTSNGTAVSAHMGTWVTDPCPESRFIPSGASFGMNHLCGYETAGQLNANAWFKCSVVSEVSGVIDFDRSLTDWTVIERGGVAQEFGLNVGNARAMGGVVANAGINTHGYITSLSGETIQIGERLAIELGITTVGRNSDSIAIEYGSHSDTYDNYTLSTGTSGTGPYGTEVIVPVNFTEANQDAWGAHSEIFIPWVSGTNTIAWADVGTDYTTTKWETTSAQRYVTRYNGAVTSQFWIFQDDDYLYIATNNIIDGCIQASDHHKIFICPSTDWMDELAPDPSDWVFCRDITAGTSVTRAPTLPVAVGDGNDQGEYVLQGQLSATYPQGWEIPSYDAPTDTFTFASNSKTWQDGVDYRFGGPGATSAAPNPGGASGGAYSELKVKKSSLNNWDGESHIGIMMVLQCDVQGQGSTMFPQMLGRLVDKLDWPWPGINYFPADTKTASTKTSADEMDLRVLMSAHAHGISPYATSTFLSLFFGCNF